MANNKVIYVHVNRKTLNPIYVGAGNPRRPYVKEGRSDEWNEIVNKDGIDIYVLEKNLTPSTAFDLEKEYIKLYGRTLNGTGTLVNKSIGGVDWMIGLKHSESTKHKMSKSRIGNTNAKGNTNRAKKIVDISTGAVFNSIQDAAEKLSIKRTTLNSWLSGQNINKSNLRYL